jgi:Txe/YoeB family toxin of Txe-Axe toxin-antitoxin module
MIIYEATTMESADQSSGVQYSIICALNNRLDKGLKLGSQGFSRADKDVFIAKQPQHIKNRIANLVRYFNKHKIDITNGADHFAYDMVPYWSKNMKLVYKIGKWKFWRSK